jgi:hypothetical protein
VGQGSYSLTALNQLAQTMRYLSLQSAPLSLLIR